MKKRVVKTIEIAISLAIMLMFFAISPNIISGQVEAISKSNWQKKSAASAIIDENHLKLFNFTPIKLLQENSETSKNAITRISTYSALYNENKVTVEITSTTSVIKDLATGYVYSAQFSSGDFSCFVCETMLKETKENQMTTTVNQIARGSYNFELLSTENKTLGNTVTKQTDLSMRLSNSSGEYFLNLKVQLELTSDEATVLSGNATLDENIYAPTGRYRVIFEQITDKTATVPQFEPSATVNATITKATIIMPDGQVVDPYCYSFCDFIPQIGIALTGAAVAWTADDLGVIGLIFAVFGPLFGISAYVAGLAYVVGIIFASAPFYVNSYGLSCMYLEVIQAMYFPYPVLYAEAGYYTDYCFGIPNGGFYFCPLSPLSTGPHQSIWPN